MQAWRVYHKPKRGKMWRRPKVHSGFDKAWRNKQLSERVLGKIQELFERGQVDKQTCHFIITG